MTEGDSRLFGAKENHLSGLVVGWYISSEREPTASSCTWFPHTPQCRPFLEHRGPSLGLPMGLEVELHRNWDHEVGGRHATY